MTNTGRMISNPLEGSDTSLKIELVCKADQLEVTKRAVIKLLAA